MPKTLAAPVLRAQVAHILIAAGSAPAEAEQVADNLVLADSNEEGAKLLALNTRQQLSQTALSLASQADQSVLRLFS